MRISIDRFGTVQAPYDTEASQFSIFSIPELGFKKFYLERQWHWNMPYQSCIPEGYYSLQEKNDKLYFVGESVTRDEVDLDPTIGVTRWGCRLDDICNWPDQLAGCGALGESIGVLFGKTAVLSSRHATEDFYRAISGIPIQNLEVRIRNGHSYYARSTIGGVEISAAPTAGEELSTAPATENSFSDGSTLLSGPEDRATSSGLQGERTAEDAE